MRVEKQLDLTLLLVIAFVLGVLVGLRGTRITGIGVSGHGRLVGGNLLIGVGNTINAN